MEYEGITLTPPNGQVSMTHSVILDYIQRESSTKNMDWFQTFLSMPWGRLKDKFPDDYFNASKLSSHSNMD